MLERILAVIKKERTAIIRDKPTMVMSLLLPLIQIVLFGFAISMNVRHIPTAVVDLSMDIASRAYLDSLVNSEYFDIRETLLSQLDAKKAIDENRVQAAVIIPSDFTEKIDRGDGNVLIMVDGADPFVSLSAYNNANIVGQEHAISVLKETISRVPGVSELVTEDPLEAQTKILYNPDLTDLWFVIPGLIAMILQVQAIALVAVSVVREREIGTMEQVLVTPITALELLIGKMIPNLFLLLANLALILFVGVIYFKVPFKGNLAEFIVMALIYILASVGLGLLVSTVSKNQKQAFQYNIMLTLISLSVSGFAFPRSQMPVVLNWIGYLFPMTYFLPMVRGVMNKGIGIGLLWPMACMLVIYVVVIIFLTSKMFRKQLD